MAERKNIREVAKKRSTMDMISTRIHDAEGKVVYDGRRELKRRVEKKNA